MRPHYVSRYCAWDPPDGRLFPISDTRAHPPTRPIAPPPHAGGVIDPTQTVDREEAAECEAMHGIIKRHGMQDCFRWIVAQVCSLPWLTGNGLLCGVWYCSRWA